MYVPVTEEARRESQILEILDPPHSSLLVIELQASVRSLMKDLGPSSASLIVQALF